MFIDFHTHLLYSLDDGSKDKKTSLDIIEKLKTQNVVGIAATPHFYPHEQESVNLFLTKRDEIFNTLKNEIDLPIILGAEVYLEKNLSLMKDLKKLCLGNSNYMLIELPYSGYKDWMLEEIYNIKFAHNVIPIMAHIERYLLFYEKKQFEQILTIQDVIFQFNNTAVLDRKSLKLLLKLIKDDQKIVFGSDTHNLTSRPPNFDLSMKKLTKKLNENQLNKILEFNIKLFNSINN